jgi:hypothetical protein
MSNIVTAIDEPGSTILFHALSAQAGTLTTSGSSALGPFDFNYTIDATIHSGSVDLIPSSIVRLKDLIVDWQLKGELGIDLNTILPQLCLPEIHITWKKWHLVITITWNCYSWPTVAVPFQLNDSSHATTDLQLIVRSDAANWYVLAKLQYVPQLTFGLSTATVVAVIGAAVIAAVAWIPLIGPFLAIVVAAATLAVIGAGLSGWLGPLLTPLLQGHEYMIYQRPRLLQLLPQQSPIDPHVLMSIKLVEATIINNGEDELVVSVDLAN